MKAIRVAAPGGPEVLKLEEIPTPKPADGQVLVRIHAVGVNPVETYIRSGKYALPPFPYTPGSDAAGIIEAAGPNVRQWKPGDRVYTSGSTTGTYAELAVCSCTQVHRLPDPISFEQGAAINIPYATAYRALFQRAKALPGETVLIHGASGGVGIAATQIAHAGGLTIIATAGTDEGAHLVKEHGAHHVLNHRHEGYLDQVLPITSGRGADIILEMLANVNLGKDLSHLARGGRIVVIGSRGTVEINPRDAMSREASILGLMLFLASDQEKASIHAALVRDLEIGVIKPVVGRRFSLADAPKAHEAVMAPGAFGKIVLIP